MRRAETKLFTKSFPQAKSFGLIGADLVDLLARIVVIDKKILSNILSLENYRRSHSNIIGISAGTGIGRDGSLIIRYDGDGREILSDHHLLLNFRW